MTTAFDLVIRNADVATASDRFSCDIGIRDGRIAALGIALEAGKEEIDASGLLVLPGGIDAHCHLDQPMPDGMRMADDFFTGTRSAACGGTTTVIPFAAQAKGGSLQAAVDDYHRRAEGKAAIDYAFHLIVADPTPQVLREELPRLIREGYTSFKIYMTYDDLKLSDHEILKVLDVAREHQALVMIHAENSDCIAWLTEGLDAAGHTAPRFHGASRPETCTIRIGTSASSENVMARCVASRSTAIGREAP
jgi:dihydropyrimidinase